MMPNGRPRTSRDAARTAHPLVPLELPPVEAITSAPLETLAPIALHLAALQVAVATRLAAPRGSADGPDRLLRVQDAAALLEMSVDWLYRHADRLPFTVRTGRSLRFSERGLRRYLAAAMPNSLDGKDRVL